ncbi:carbon-nitrogen hydrolase family protein (plasmid) [Deinococcus sp. KNUC1210]|uniref:carbon-nitrogen hydrolase family protein n=1 Tax=Deinococcus sp. KNUC1210 TaxID=2917691 RepID=UPI001EF0357B|nr:carbon-nitrogen hydrolase family protein [Deinococcus sp. KNUC1210]ULH17722.1 carbon-nitrogen hydrolase family protein [Deinococcus sp. KNUC1210]
MARVLPIAVVQDAPFPLTAPLSDFTASVESLLGSFPQTRLIVYPELHLFGGAAGKSELNASAEPLDGPRLQTLAQLAGDLGVWLVPGSVCERGPAGQLFNTAVALSPEGKLAATYRKLFPWRPYEPFDPGEAFVTFDLPDIGRAGFSICYDAWFPEVTRHLAWMGAQVVLNVVKTTTCDRAQEVILARANAIVNQVFVVSVNAAGPVGTGQSLIVDPEGLVRASASGANVTVLTDVLDLGHGERARTYGTAGLTRPWSQFQPGDTPIRLPLYGGEMSPERWNPDRND